MQLNGYPWNVVRLGDHVDFLSGFAFKSKGFTENRDDVPLVKGSNVHQGFIDWNDSKYWSRNDTGAYERFFLEPDDVVLAMDRPWIEAGLKYSWIRAGSPKALLVQRVCRLRGTNGLITRYLRFVIGSPAFTDYIKPIVTGVNVPHISGEQIRSYCFPLPPLSVQRKVVEILSAYDELIENNTRRIAILESMAQALYQEWFVRFRFPGHENVPVVDGVPTGWKRSPLADCARFLSGGTPAKSRLDYWQGTIPWISSGELTAMRVRDSSLYLSKEGAEEGSRLVPPETTLVVVRGMSLAKEFRMGMVSREVAFNQDLKALQARPGVDPYLLFHTLRDQRDQIRDRATEATHGTKKLDTRVLEQISVVVPDDGRQKLFRDHVEPLHRLWDTLNHQSKVLRRTRDILLPKLISGQIDLEHLDIDVGADLVGAAP